MSKKLNLTILQPLQAKLLSNQNILLTRKLIEAVEQLKNYWPGSITIFMEETHQEHDILDKRVFNLNELPFKLKLISFNQIKPEHFQNQTSLVLATVSHRQNHISQLCKKAAVPCIYVSEYSLKTRQQIVNVTTGNPAIRMRKYLWELEQERKQRNAIALADGVQCNGTPTYNIYHRINRHPLLFFDTRITEDMLATPEEVERRTDRHSSEEPIRLLFSGRLIKMKGADHLLEVAIELKRLKVPFQFYISGAGVLEPVMQQTIASHQLKDCVIMMGLPDFRTEFFPFVKNNIDLFVCCHRQGDPSCTYIETMSCGVPIVGYANEAFAGMVEQSNTGWLVEMDKPKRMAAKIAEINRDRTTLKAMSFNSLKFAKQHTFEKTFATRVDHIMQIAKLGVENRV